MNTLAITKKELGYILLGVTILCLSITWFSAPLGLVTGGISGIGIVLEEVSEALIGVRIPLWLTTILLNLPLFLISIRQRGFDFAKKSLYAVALTSFSLWYMEFIPNPFMIGDDMFLSAVFGGAGIGMGIGLVLKASATTGGSDMLASILKFKYPSFPIAKLMFFIDGVIILIGFFVFSAKNTMYAIVAVMVITRVVSAVLEGGHHAKVAFIISPKNEAIAAAVMREIPRGSTGLKARGMYSKEEREILFTVVSQTEISKLREIIYAIDPKAFVTIADVKEVLGEGFIQEYNGLML